MQSEQGIAEVNGTRIRYELTGQGTPLVLIHGFTLDLRIWDDQMADLSRRYRVLELAPIGHGRRRGRPSQR